MICHLESFASIVTLVAIFSSFQRSLLNSGCCERALQKQTKRKTKNVSVGVRLTDQVSFSKER